MAPAIVRVDYDTDEDKIKKFLQEFQDLDGTLKYMDQLQEIANRSRRTFDLDLEDLDPGFDELGTKIRQNTKRYSAIFAKAIDKILPQPTSSLEEEDVYDVMCRARNQNFGNQELNSAQTTLLRRYELRIIPQSKEKPESLRNIRAVNIGQLVTVRAMVSRVSDVKPMVEVATYTCEQCSEETYQVITGRSFMPVEKCMSPSCRQYNTNSKLVAQTRGSKFVKFQELKVQELPDQVPTGHIPRTMTVHLKGELTRTCAPGEEVIISGVFLPVPYTGYKAIKAGLTADTYMEATNVKKTKQRYEDYTLTPEMIASIEKSSKEANTYAKLANSIAPEIFGMEDVKKALLLQLVGAADRTLTDGLHIRGDMHICLMGDPGVAKSQLLKHISKLAPRGVYTTGKGSSGVGLTASVVRDQFTSELMLEGGALVLADQGICCIDEFDKMEETDRTSIHEVMEQQTVSIAKAGITTTLNARTSVLAAANPAYGRYNIRRSPSENINLPQALLSRFDLLFLLMDKVNSTVDFNLARHITHVHRFQTAPQVDDDDVFDSSFLRGYISHARRVQPAVPPELTEYIVGAYISMRSDEEPADSRNYFFTTARTLLSILRLSQALARLRFDERVEQSDVDEAIRLMRESKRSLFDEADAAQRSYDPTSSIFEMAKQLALAAAAAGAGGAGGDAGASLRYAELEGRVVMKGFTKKQLEECVAAYQQLNVWQLEASGAVLRFVDSV